MKNLVTIIFLLSFLSYAQDWQTVTKDDFNEVHAWYSTSPAYKRFKINPNNNTLWFSFSKHIYSLDSNGVYVKHNYLSDPVLPSGSAGFPDFEFAHNKVYTFDIYPNKVLSYDGTSWVELVDVTSINSLTSDGDTIFVSQGTGNNFSITSSGNNFHSYSSSGPIQSRNGVAWTASGVGGGSSNQQLYRYYTNTNFEYYSADTAAFLLDNANHDFKYAHNSDTLFTAGDRGFSLAFNHVFLDTLTAFNTTNMPANKIVEFEFDQNDNIWALFGDDLNNVNYIAYLDRSINNWSMVYDSSNSPVDFSGGMSIELDSHGNLYVMQTDRFHILKINNAPDWLSLNEVEPFSFSMFPNPATDEVSLKLSDNRDHDVMITDVQGQQVHHFKAVNSHLKIDFSSISSGIYFISVDDLVKQKIIKL